MSDTTKMTPAAYERLKAEIEQLEGEARLDIAKRIGTAREWGDLKENAEYHDAKNSAAMLEARISRLRQQQLSAEIVDAADGGETAGMGSTVTYTDEQTNKRVTYKLVSRRDANPGEGSLSIDSPVGKALAGSKPGDVCTIDTPKGKRAMRIVAIEHS